MALRSFADPLPANRWDLLDGVTPAQPPTVSVVVPWYADQARLDLVLTGLAMQTHPASRLQVVIADDGSPVPPDTGALTGGADLVVVRQADLGFRAGAARNLGARAATGDVLSFIDADTVPEAGYVAALTRLPALCRDAVVVGRRRHADLTGWTPERLRRWFTGGAPAPAELTEPAWLARGHAASRDLLDADDRSYRFVISAVIGCGAALFAELAGFDESFTRYGGEDWEWANRAWHAGAVLAHVPGAVAWHDGPDWAGRTADPAAARREKNAETLELAARITEPTARGTGRLHPYPDLVVRLEVPTDRVHAGLLTAQAVLTGNDARVWLRGGGAAALAELYQGDPRVSVGEPPSGVLARARYRLDVSAPVALTAAAVPDLTAQLRSEGLGRISAGPLTLTASRALGRAQRHGAPTDTLLATLFGVRDVDPTALGVGSLPDEPDLAAAFAGA